MWVITKNNDKYDKSPSWDRGLEEEFTVQSDSPQVGKETMRMFLVFATVNNWIVNTFDVKSACLQCQKIERYVNIQPPKGV
jgi:hypothetical protein